MQAYSCNCIFSKVRCFLRDIVDEIIANLRIPLFAYWGHGRLNDARLDEVVDAGKKYIWMVYDFHRSMLSYEYLYLLFSALSDIQ